MSMDITPQNHLEWLDPFFAELARASRRALLLDYDGTLAPLRQERAETAFYPGVRERLQRILDGNHTRLVFITGRRVKNLMPLLEISPTPEIWGSHGWERRTMNGTIQTQPMEPSDEAAIARLMERLAERGLKERCERKPGCLTLHLRGLSVEAAAQARDETIEEAPALIAGSALQLRDYHGGVEFYLPEQHKGLAVQTVLDESGEDCVTAFLGDDVTDEEAFRLLKGRGHGILVRKEARPSAARHWLRPPDELLDFLERWAGLGGNR